MIHSNKRKLNLLLFLAACIFVSVAATKPSFENTAVNKTGVHDTGMFKNLKILPKNISKDSLDAIMDHFKASLGVRCNFCHANGDNGRLDFASDAKPEKDVARYMMTMTAGINAQYFNMDKSTRPDTIAVVKCVTCHHGNPHPEEAGMAAEHQDNMPPPGMPHDSSGKMPPMHDSSGKMPPPPDQH